MPILGEKPLAVTYQRSGAENISYVDLASALAAKMGVDPVLLAPTTASEKGVHIAFKPRYSGLGMRRTTEITGVRPQPLADVVSDLLAQT